MKPRWLKIAMTVGTVAAAVLGGLAGGPVVAAGAGVSAAVAALGGLYHDKPKRKAKQGELPL